MRLAPLRISGFLNGSDSPWQVAASELNYDLLIKMDDDGIIRHPQLYHSADSPLSALPGACDKKGKGGVRRMTRARMVRHHNAGEVS